MHKNDYELNSDTYNKVITDEVPEKFRRKHYFHSGEKKGGSFMEEGIFDLNCTCFGLRVLGWKR